MKGSDLYYDRQTLYEEVWTEPVYKVAQRYGVSNVAIAKTCRKMHIPVPGRGFWNKVQSGQKMKKIPLPEYEKCPRIKKNNPRFDTDTPKKEKERLVPEAFTMEDQLLQKETLPEMRISFNPDIRLTNQFVLNTKRNLAESMKRINGYLDFGRCTSGCDEAFHMQIWPASIPRAMAILQTLCYALEKRGYPIGIQPGHQKREVLPVCANVLNTCIFFKITETSNKRATTEQEKKDTYRDYKYVPSGKLCFEIINNPYRNHGRNRWYDGKVAKLENQLNDIIINMIRASTATKEAQAWAEVQSKQREIEDAERKVQELSQQRNKARMDYLAKETERYVKFRQIKEYIEIIAAEGKKRLGDTYPSSDFSRWVEWAELYLKKNGPDTWELPKFDVPENQWSTRIPSRVF